MSDQNPTPIASQQYSPQVPHSLQNNDEIDLRELCKAFWDGKWVIISLTFLLAVIAVLFALKQPNIYKSQALFIVESSFYGSAGVREPSFSPKFFDGSEIKNLVVSFEEEDKSKLKGLSVSYDRRSSSISISKTSQDPLAAFEGVALYSRNLNQVLKSIELEKVMVSIEALMTQLPNSSEKTKEYLDTLLAQQLFKKALLENPNSTLVQIINEPVKPTSHIKPKRARIVFLGSLLGVILGVAIVLFRYLFRRKDY